MPHDQSAQMLAAGRQVLERQPFSRLLGAELTDFGPGYAEIRLPCREDLKQQRGVTHGGVLAYLADNVQTFAGGSVLGEKCATLETKINYMRPAISGLLIARAKVVGGGKRTAVTSCEILNQQDGNEMVVVAVAQGTIITLD
jgi:uncharacterized protein (TIGR00369 family)